MGIYRGTPSQNTWPNNKKIDRIDQLRRCGRWVKSLTKIIVNRYRFDWKKKQLIEI